MWSNSFSQDGEQAPEANAELAQTSDDWITVSKKSGYVTAIDSLDVSIDWNKVSEDKTGTIVIKADDNTVSITVTAKHHNIQNLEEKTYVYANGYASMLAGNYSRLVSGKDGASFRTIENYGKMGQSIKAFPSTVSYAEDVKQAPYAEYPVQVPEDGNYKLTVYTAPSNNIDRTQVSLRCGIGAGDGEIQLVDSIDSNYIGGTSNDWSNTVKANGHKKEVTISLKAGVNTIRYYAVDPAVVLQKLVISEQSVKNSHLGPQESYYVGKTVKAAQSSTAVTDTLYSIPGNIDLQQCAAKKGDSYSIRQKGETETHYQFQILENSGSGYSKVFNEFTLKQPVQTDAVKIEIYTSYWVRLVDCEIAQSHKFSPFAAK